MTPDTPRSGGATPLPTGAGVAPAAARTRWADRSVAGGGVIVAASATLALIAALLDSEALDAPTFAGGVVGGLVAAAGALGWLRRGGGRIEALGLIVLAAGLVAVGHVHRFYAAFGFALEAVGMLMVGLAVLAHDVRRRDGAVLVVAVPVGIGAAAAAFSLSDGSAFGVDAWGIAVGVALAVAATFRLAGRR